MRITELDYNALIVALEEYKNSDYYNYYKGGSIIEAIEEDRVYFTEDGHIFGEYRICSHCGKDMTDGYILYDGDFYYCSDECLYSNVSKEQYLQMYEEDEAFYTEWY